VPLVANPRMALSSHLEGILNGIFLVLLGLVYPKLRLSRFWLTTAFWLAIYSGFPIGELLFWPRSGPRARSCPWPGKGSRGPRPQEAIIDFLLYSLSFAMVTVCVIVLWGHRRPKKNLIE